MHKLTSRKVLPSTTFTHSIHVATEKCSEKTTHKKPQSFRSKSGAGFIALISVLIIGAVVLVVGIGLSLRSIGETNMSLSEQESARALALANLCAEQALMKLESFLNYSGSESILIGSESCYILAVSGSGNLNRTIQASSTVFNHTKKVQVVVTEISPVMMLSSWEEVADF